MSPPDERSKPEISLPEPEYERLMELLDDAPRPATYVVGVHLRRRAKDLTRGREPILKGPNGKELLWMEPGWTDPKVLVSRYGPGVSPSKTFLALGARSYSIAPRDDRVLVWRQLRRSLPGAMIRLSLFDTTRLVPIGRRWSLLWRYEGWDPVIWKDGLVASTDVPLELSPGIHPVPFPEPMRTVEELLMIGFPFAGQERARRTTIFVARPEDGTVEVVPLGRWAGKTRMRGFIARVSRDPLSRNIVGDGVGVKPFLIRPTGDLLGWAVRRRKKRRAIAPTGPRAKEPP